MHPADSVVQILSDATPRREHPEVVGAYRQLAGLIEAHLIGESFFEVTPPDALSSTQWALIRHGLRGMGEGTAFQSIQRAATQLRTTLKTSAEESLPDVEMPDVTDEFAGDAPPAGYIEPVEDLPPAGDAEDIVVEEDLAVEDVEEIAAEEDAEPVLMIEDEDAPTTLLETVDEPGDSDDELPEAEIGPVYEDTSPEGVIGYINDADVSDIDDGAYHGTNWDDEMPLVSESEFYEPQDDVEPVDEPGTDIIVSDVSLDAQTADGAYVPPARDQGQPNAFKEEYQRENAVNPRPPRGFRFTREPQVINYVEAVQDNSTVNMYGIVTNNNQTIAMDDVITAQASTIDSSNTIISGDTDSQSTLEYDVFLSYSRRDAKIMRRLKQELLSEGFTVWTDENLTPGTDDWQMAIETAILKSGSMVTLMSPDAHVSRWVKTEINFARDHGVLVVPVLISGDERTSIPFALTLTQHIDMRREAYRVGKMELLRVLRIRRRDLSS